jgi:predicted DNA-binding transcriptional regulator AlpA
MANENTTAVNNYFRPLDAARYLRISHPLLRKLERLNQGPRRAKLGRAVVYRKIDLDEFMAARVGQAA